LSRISSDGVDSAAIWAPSSRWGGRGRGGEQPCRISYARRASRARRGDEPMTAAEIAPRLTALRAELKRHGLAGFLVPRADEHQGEYVPPHAERLRWLTGFSGSAGGGPPRPPAAAGAGGRPDTRPGPAQHRRAPAR